MNKPLTLTFEDTPETRSALRYLAEIASRNGDDTGDEQDRTFRRVDREIAKVLAMPPEPVDQPLYDGGGDQP
jgi:hypothetical protein